MQGLECQNIFATGETFSAALSVTSRIRHSLHTIFPCTKPTRAPSSAPDTCHTHPPVHRCLARLLLRHSLQNSAFVRVLQKENGELTGVAERLQQHVTASTKWKITSTQLRRWQGNKLHSFVSLQHVHLGSSECLNFDKTSSQRKRECMKEH